jgi:hypothetical protein
MALYVLQEGKSIIQHLFQRTKDFTILIITLVLEEKEIMLVYVWNCVV